VALTAIQIYQLLPKTNCGDCGVPTCLAFAMKIAQKQAAIEQCPHVTDEAKAALGAAAAPPMATVTIGAGDRALSIGGETVLFRHEETFYRPPGIAVELCSALPPDELAARVNEIAALKFDRVGRTYGVDMLALRQEGSSDEFATAAGIVAENTDMPVILVSDDPAAMTVAADRLPGRKPLLYAATAQNLDEMAAVAGEKNCVLALRANGDLSELLTLSERAQAAGVKDLVLDSGAASLSAILAHQTAIRRACLRKKVRPLGYPTIVFATQDDPSFALMAGITAICKYAGIVVLNSADPEALLALITARLNIYTDPQKPIQISSGLYRVGEPNENSPVLVTTNFSLTYYTVEGEVAASKVPAWIVVVDTEGTSVMTAWAADKFTPEIIAQTVKQCNVEENVSHRRLVIPGGVAVLKGKLEEESGWDVIVGPREATGIPKFLKTSWLAAA
jgi:acetyl-CoA decarbonylase/synthase complex subunit gamma